MTTNPPAKWGKPLAAPASVAAPPSSAKMPAPSPAGFPLTELIGSVSAGIATSLAASLVGQLTPLGERLSAAHPTLPLATASLCGVLGSGLVATAAHKTVARKQISFTCGPMKWDRNAFCRGWLITGTTGSGKTVFISRMLHELCKREVGGETKDKKGNKVKLHRWGGIAIDEKGLYYETMEAIFKTYNRLDDLVLLQTRPLSADESWKPAVTFNLLSDDRIPANTYAHAIVKTAATIAGGEGDKGFFKTQAESNIGWGIELCRALARCQKSRHRAQCAMAQAEAEKNPSMRIRLPEAPVLVYPSLKGLLDILTAKKDFDNLLARAGVRTYKPQTKEEKQAAASGKLSPKSVQMEWTDDYTLLDDEWPEVKKLKECMAHFENRYWSLLQSAPEQILGVQGTIYNYLNYFGQDEVAEVFCGESSIGFDMIDHGKVFCVAMPQKFAIERRYVCTLLKLLYYQHVLRRFDDKPSLAFKNLLIGWMDEAQRFIQPDDGNVDVLREARATIVVATQSKTSLRPPLGGREKADPIILNLRNRVICKAADEECAKESADFIGKAPRMKKSRQVQSRGDHSSTYNMEDRYIIEPYQFRGLQDFTAVVCHAEGRWKSLHFTPIGNNGQEEPWWGGCDKVPAAMRWRRKLGMRPDTCNAPLPMADKRSK